MIIRVIVLPTPFRDYLRSIAQDNNKGVGLVRGLVRSVRRIARNQLLSLEKLDLTMAIIPSFPSSLIFIIKAKYENNQRSKSINPGEDKPSSQAKPFEEDGDREAANQGKAECVNASVLADNPAEGRR